MPLAKNSILYLVSTISLKAVGFLLLPLYTHLVSPTEYGYVYVVSAFQTFMGLFLSMSMQGAIGRFYFDCKNYKDINKMYSQQVYAVTIIASILSIIMILFRKNISVWVDLPEKYFVYAVLISYFSMFYNLVIALFYAMEKAVKISITSIFIGICTIAVQIILVFTLSDKAQALILAMLITAILSFFIFLYYSKPFFVKPNINKKDIAKYFKYSISQLPSDVSVWFVAASDRILLNSMQGAYSAGIYGMGNTLGQIPTMLFQSVNKAYVPFVFRHYKDAEQGKSESLVEVARSTTILECVLSCVVVVLIIMSNNIVSLLEGRYVDSSYIMPMVLVAVWIDCNRIIFMNPLAYNVRYVKVKSLIWVLAAVLNVSLNLYMIPRYSIYGACISLIVSYGVSFALILFYSNKAFRVCYEGNKIIKTLALSIIFSLGYFIGHDLYAFIIKMFVITLYIIMIVNINNIKFKLSNNHVKILYN